MSKRDYVKDLDQCMPAAANALLGTTLQALITAINAVAAFIGTAGGATGIISSAVLKRGSTDKNFASAAFNFFINGLAYNKTAVTVGTAIGAQTVPQNTWAIYRVSINASGTITATPGAANATTGYATEALAKAALPAVPTNEANMGYFTVLTMVDTQWIAATDALAGGTTGNEASETNYYQAALSLPVALTNINDLP